MSTQKVIKSGKYHWHPDVYNTPQELDRGLRWLVVCRNSKEGRKDGKEKDA